MKKIVFIPSKPLPRGDYPPEMDLVDAPIYWANVPPHLVGESKTVFVMNPESNEVLFIVDQVLKISTDNPNELVLIFGPKQQLVSIIEILQGRIDTQTVDCSHCEKNLAGLAGYYIQSGAIEMTATFKARNVRLFA